MLPAPLAVVILASPLRVPCVIAFYRNMLFSLVLKNAVHVYYCQGMSPNNTIYREEFIDVSAVLNISYKILALNTTLFIFYKVQTRAASLRVTSSIHKRLHSSCFQKHFL